MYDSYIPLIAGFVGALIGAGASVITILIQSHYQNKREITKQSFSLALEDWKTRANIEKKVLPLGIFINYHFKMVALVEKGELTPEAIEKLGLEVNELSSAMQGTSNK